MPGDKPCGQIALLIAGAVAVFIQSDGTGGGAVAPHGSGGLLSHDAQIFLFFGFVELPPGEDDASGVELFGAPKHDAVGLSLAGEDQELTSAEEFQYLLKNDLHRSLQSGFNADFGGYLRDAECLGGAAFLRFRHVPDQESENNQVNCPHDEMHNFDMLTNQVSQSGAGECYRIGGHGGG